MDIAVDAYLRLTPTYCPVGGAAHSHACSRGAKSSFLPVVRRLSLVTFVALLLAAITEGQTRPIYETSPQTEISPVELAELPAPQALRDYVSQGKLQLTLDDAIRLALLNNPDLQIEQSKVAEARYDVLSAYHPFDPAVISGFNVLRSNSASFNQLAG